LREIWRKISELKKLKTVLEMMAAQCSKGRVPECPIIDAPGRNGPQDIAFTVLATPSRTFRARLNYVASAFDPVSRRLLVRATVENSDGVLKPGMFASVTLFSDSDPSEVHTPAVSTQRSNLRG
jgi:multidrug efflux pump subunit AcrA (membrane-fusion protein)